MREHNPTLPLQKLNIGLLEETNHVFGLVDGTKSYPVGIVKDVEVHIGKLKLLNDFYVIDIKKDPKTPLLVGRGFLATANAVIDCRMAKIAVGEGITRSCKFKIIQKEAVEIKSFKSSTQNSTVNDFIVINIPEEDVEPKQIILDPDDQPMWESAKTVAPTPNSAIVQIDVDDNFVINSTHLKMICENKFDGYLRADPHDHIREFLAICDMFKYGETQSEAVKLLIFPYSLSDKAKTWFNELNEESITSWDQMRKVFINKLFPSSLFNRRLLEIGNFSQLVCESLIDAWLRLKSMLRKCHGHGLTKGAIIQIFYHGLDEPTQGILDITAGGIFLYKSPNQAFQFLEDKVLFNLDCLKEELEDMLNKYYDLKNNHASKNDDTLMCERHEVNYIQYEGYQNQNSHDSYFHQSHHDLNDPEKSLTELNRDVRNDLEDFKSCIHSMRTVYDKLFDRDNKSKTGLKKLITKFLDGQRVLNMYIKNNDNAY
ncbi:reverse transcriptase domain-containing protein [Tanacetum coccineum]